ncbi:MAG: type IV pilus twitching motility protein PilT [Phycisphaeraceae bacterium]|nr:type IV pilus twitching motility protein PilT [Phycisphaeraceae bacterium]MBX3361606.1 type IV pilus twitching motility protein PilT [Phycisphaeraceae bacterium]MBX3368350.1 type IV pilus twitching motility protein PilT [Phycisphaeraceae bacterium]MCW5768298.1 type IV pilus twitching motility protein PilT [Phycisphaeraceae bacterium]QYK48865.1 MAG: type IV pilus twitching motility protein PilT [Phycisphaeraceae bacterium]
MSSQESSQSARVGPSMQIDRLLDTVVKLGASDLHLTVNRRPTIRHHGHLKDLQTKILDSDDMVGLMKSITPERNQQELQEEGGTDFGFAYGDAARFRVSVFRQRGDIAIVLRQIPNRLLTFEQIGLPEMCRELIRRPRGMFLVTGPTGSGKTTSLATMIDYINQTMDRHIVTMEDPIEYYHKHKKSIVNQREVGNDVPSFAEALRRALRQDPDVILVGEMRDLETIEAAVRAAETGHLVFGTLHTTGAAKTIDRLVDAFPVTQQNQIRVQLSTALISVLSQVLLSRTDQPGMVAGYEFLVVTPAIANLIRENKTFRIDSAIQTGKRFGMQLLDDHLWSLYSRDMISAEEMIDKSKNPADLTDKVHRLGRTVGRSEWDQDDVSA